MLRRTIAILTKAGPWLLLLALSDSSALAEDDYVVSRRAILENCKGRKANEIAADRCRQAVLGIGLMSGTLADGKAVNLCMSEEAIETAADKLVTMIEASSDKLGIIENEEKMAVGAILLCP